MKILSEINTKLNKLDNIEKHLERIDDEINKLKNLLLLSTTQLTR